MCIAQLAISRQQPRPAGDSLQALSTGIQRYLLQARRHTLFGPGGREFAGALQDPSALIKTQQYADRTVVKFALRSRSLIAALVLGNFITQAETTQSLWRFGHPNAKSLIGMHVQGIRQSALGRTLEEQWRGALGKSFPELDLIDQVDSVLVSSPGSKGAADNGEPPLLAAASGHFDLIRLRQSLLGHGATSQWFDSVAVYRPHGKGSREFAIAPLDEQTILAGDAQSVFSAIERLRLPPGENTNALFGRAEVLDAEYDFWVLMPASSALGRQRLPFGELLQGLTGLEAGLSVKDGLSFRASIFAATESNARKMLEQARKLFKLAAKDQATRPELALLAKNVTLSLEASRITVALRIDRKDLDSGLHSLRGRHNADVMASSPPKLVIRIEGLNEGVREVPFNAVPSNPGPHR